MCRHLETLLRQCLVDRVRRVRLRHVEVAKHDQISRITRLARGLAIRPLGHYESLQRAAVDILLLFVTAEEQMHRGKEDSELACLERCEVGITIEASERLRDPRETDVSIVLGWERHFTDLFEQRDLRAVIEEGEPLVIT